MRAKRLFVNALTFARVPLILLWAIGAIVVQFKSASMTPVAGIVWSFVAGAGMFLSGITDLFDGKLARKWGVVSTLGKMADPLMDKVFFLVAFPILLWQIVTLGGEGSTLHALVMLVFTILYMLRDTWVTFLRSVGSMYGADVAAMWIGKVRTALSFPAAGFVYAYLALSPHLLAGEFFSPGLIRCWYWSCLAVEIFLIVLTVWTLVVYSLAYAPHLKKALEHTSDL